MTNVQCNNLLRVGETDDTMVRRYAALPAWPVGGGFFFCDHVYMYIHDTIECWVLGTLFVMSGVSLERWVRERADGSEGNEGGTC